MTSEANAPNRLREALLQEIAAQGNTRRYAAHTVLVHDHDDNDSLFIILGGRVKVYAANASGKEAILNSLGPGEYLGELALDGRGRRRADAPSGIERCARGGCVRSEPRRHRAPAGAAGRWLACVVLTLHQLERLLRCNQLRAVNVADGS
jgi:Cyclic nucleotide-binding domain